VLLELREDGVEEEETSGVLASCPSAAQGTHIKSMWWKSEIHKREGGMGMEREGVSPHADGLTATGSSSSKRCTIEILNDILQTR